MIETSEQLDAAVDSLGLLYRALASLRAKVPDPRKFALYAEGPVDMINEIQAEIDAYTGRLIAEEYAASDDADERLCDESDARADNVA